MNDYSRDIIFLFKDQELGKDSIDQELEFIHRIIENIDNKDSFCEAHELVFRNRITNKKRRILKASNQSKLKAFHFLINKN